MTGGTMMTPDDIDVWVGLDVGKSGGCLIVCVWDHLIERKRSW
ncbi:hypothetical protein [Bifidobacterium longum]